MYSLVDKIKVKAGRLIKVFNKNKPKFSNANDCYTAVWVENEKGKQEKCLLFTEKELERAAYRASRNKEDLTEKSWFSDLTD